MAVTKKITRAEKVAANPLSMPEKKAETWAPPTDVPNRLADAAQKAGQSLRKKVMAGARLEPRPQSAKYGRKKTRGPINKKAKPMIVEAYQKTQRGKGKPKKGEAA